MNRDYDENLLLGYVEGDLSADQRAEVERWMADDPRLAALLRGMADDRRAVRDLPEPTPPEWVMDDVDRGLERTMLLDSAAAEINGDDVEQRHGVRRVAFGLAAAASVLLAAGVVIWSVTGPNIEPVTLDREVAMDDHAAPTEPDVELDEQAEQTVGGDRMALTSEPSDEPIGVEDQAADASTGAMTDSARDLAPVASKQAPADTPRETFVLNGAAPAEQPVADAPAEDQLVVVMRTRDVERSVRQLNFVVSNIAEAEVEPLDETSNELLMRDRLDGGAVGMKLGSAVADETKSEVAAAQRSAANVDAIAETRPGQVGQAGTERAREDQAAEPTAGEAGNRAEPLRQRRVDNAPQPAVPAQQRYAYNLFVPADQVDKVLELLKEDRPIGEDATESSTMYQRIELNRGLPEAYREQVGRRFDDGDAYANARRNWPRRAPDYGYILRQQLPLETREVATQRPRAEQVTIPVIIEAQPDDAAD